MGFRLLNESFVRQRSEELQIPYENILAAAILEEVIQRIMESEYSDSFWIKNNIRMNLENYRRKVDLNLTFYIQDTEKLHYKKAEVSDAFSHLFRNLKKDMVHWNYNIWMDWNMIYINLTGAISSVKVPIKIKLEHITEERLNPKIKDMHFIINNNRILHLKCYPSEYIVVEKFIVIMEKLELINNVSCYLDIYEILKREELSGRKVCELLREGCKEHGIEINEQRLELLIAYRTNNFMKKKWKSYLRHEKKKSPDWDDVLNIIEKFFTAIWSSMCNNLIYLGDWMPELGRFID